MKFRVIWSLLAVFPRIHQQQLLQLMRHHSWDGGGAQPQKVVVIGRKTSCVTADAINEAT